MRSLWHILDGNRRNISSQHLSKENKLTKKQMNYLIHNLTQCFLVNLKMRTRERHRHSVSTKCGELIKRFVQRISNGKWKTRNFLCDIPPLLDNKPSRRSFYTICLLYIYVTRKL